jgi:hypothetical protein
VTNLTDTLLRLAFLVALAACLVLTVEAPKAQTGIAGLDFPGNGSTVRFRWMNPQNIELPIYGPNGRGVTYIWRAYPRQQASYYTTLFWANDDGSCNLSAWFWQNGNINSTYGAHPYPNPPPNGTNHFWEIAIEGQDIVKSTNIVYDRWYTQAFRVWGAPGNVKHHEFYYDLPDTSKVITYTTNRSNWGDSLPPGPALTVGDAPHNCGAEVYKGVLRGFQFYNNLLSVSDIQNEINSPRSTAAGSAAIWYLNLNPTPSDISDKSGKGHHPSWVGSGRPGLYGDGGAPAPPAAPTSVRIIQ